MPADAIEKERELLTELTRNEGKPENAIEKIVAGRLNGFYKDYCLLEQGFVKEPKTTIAKLVEGLGAARPCAGSPGSRSARSRVVVDPGRCSRSAGWC